MPWKLASINFDHMHMLDWLHMAADHGYSHGKCPVGQTPSAERRMCLPTVPLGSP